jgi:hypothetical protein
MNKALDFVRWSILAACLVFLMTDYTVFIR